MKLFKDILKQIKKYDNIVIARHIGADPDALGSQFALKELIEINFRNKHVYAVGSIAARFKFMGSTDKIDNLENADKKILMNAWHNKKIKEEELNERGIVRVYTWKEILDMLDY